MAKVVYSGAQLSVPHSRMVELRKPGKVNLGIDHDVAVKLASLGIHPQGTAAAAFGLYKGLALIVGGVGLYMAFTSAWWWGVLGVIGTMVIWSGNKAGHSENLLDSAMSDEGFYERVRELNGWRYQIDEAEAADFLR
ncbi:hypothetical protein FJ938_11155 [Mesorhizobium sp. B2-4-14]|uniref:hypothetical protein n=1 Tax=Mesorhizobium sp. B2-4-14 TaxID=2589935 RepID=UPI0011262CF6|nr:hypothetical protein [Mesorhizobium sp. B2-4-14]TPL07590.1 hypothetical protein FJ938_11155 [Mesorhizobium sp. B2-4-14]